MATIRRLEIKDVDECTELGEKFHAETLYSQMPYNKNKIRAQLYQIISREADCIGLVVESEGKIVGFIAGHTQDYFFNDEIFASENCLYIHPDQRGAFTSTRLIMKFIEWAQSKDCREVVIETAAGIDKERVGEFLQRLGFAHVGGVYKYTIPIKGD